jgi:hypothetical protein
MLLNSTTVKTGNLVGSDISVATLVYDFDRPLYHTWAPSCAKGKCLFVLLFGVCVCVCVCLCVCVCVYVVAELALTFSVCLCIAHAGFCEPTPPDEEDPCFPGCDFTLKGDLCGTHPNPECDCSAVRNATGWCEGEHDWYVIYGAVCVCVWVGGVMEVRACRCAFCIFGCVCMSRSVYICMGIHVRVRAYMCVCVGGCVCVGVCICRV